MLEEKGDLLEVAALTLFFNEKYFSAIKLAVVSFNNMLIHFEDEYKIFYTEKIEKFMMPLLNRLKRDLHKIMIKYEDDLTPDRLANFSITKNEIKHEFLPSFRKVFESNIILPSFEKINLENLRN